MITEKKLYKIGDWIVHVFYGLGQVIGKDNKVLGGEKLAFLKVKTSDSFYWIPLANVDNKRIRPLASKNQFDYALSLFQKPPKKLSKDYQQRRKDISQTLHKISLYSRVRMIRDLNGRRNTSKFNINENNVLVYMKDQLLDEWTLVMNEDRKILETKLNKALKVSVENV